MVCGFGRGRSVLAEIVDFDEYSEGGLPGGAFSVPKPSCGVSGQKPPLTRGVAAVVSDIQYLDLAYIYT